MEAREIGRRAGIAEALKAGNDSLAGYVSTLIRKLEMAWTDD